MDSRACVLSRGFDVWRVTRLRDGQRSNDLKRLPGAGFLCHLFSIFSKVSSSFELNLKCFNTHGQLFIFWNFLLAHLHLPGH